MSEIQDIVESWIRSSFDYLETDWEDSGGESGGFEEMISDIVYDVASDVESDIDAMVEDNLSNYRHYEIEEMIQSRIAEIEPEEEEE